MLRFVGVAAVVGIVVAAVRLPPLYDETYYWVWSHHLSWTYLDHPPGIAVAIALFRTVLGEGQLALRALSLSCMAIVVALAWKTSVRLCGTREAGPVALLTLLGSLMFVVGYLPATPDPLQGVVLALAAWAVVRALEPKRVPAYEAAAAFLLSVSVLIKQSSVLVAAGALIGALVSAPARRRVFTRATVMGLVPGVAWVAIWLAWDLAAPEGATHFQGRRVFSGENMRPLMGPMLVVGALAGTLGPTTAFGLMGAPYRPRLPAVSVLGGGAWALLAGSTVAAVFGAGEANWLMPALVFGLPAVVAFTLERPPFRRLHLATCVTFAGAGWVILAHIAYPFLPVDPAADRTLRSAGYEQVAERVAALAREHKTTKVIARRYQTASQLIYHLGSAFAVHELGTGRRSQFDLWLRPPLCAGEVAIAVSRSPNLFLGFEGIGRGAEEVSRRRNGRTVETLYVSPVLVRKPHACAG